MNLLSLSQCDYLDKSNWLQTWSRDERLDWHQEEPSFRKFINLKEDFPITPPRHVLLDTYQSLKTLWGL
jgi:hypothetical protein